MITASNEYVKVLQMFVPEGFQTSAHTFSYYLSTLTQRRYDIQNHSIDVTASGIEIFMYRPAYTPTQKFTWNELKRLIDTEYGVKIHSPRLQSLFDQLGKAF
ncbi:hypothetical protein [Flavobacterium cerinum]|uniref:Uncharacterized protein n=1 Tax=Flavobacterium cerinum TaxID=2502784 RepID=A0A444HAR9_9FLAO|nr:hypothetical protein [Flavobacterium cerinum]RWX00409.1 hypothetical protein EPI11_09020 [Flavobacterium cerinum]